jgi:hypothetical protein
MFRLDDNQRGARDRGPIISRHNLVFGGSISDRNHDAAMRIGGEAPRRRAHSADGIKAMASFG